MSRSCVAAQQKHVLSADTGASLHDTQVHDVITTKNNSASCLLGRACMAAQQKRLLRATADAWRWRCLLAPALAAWRAHAVAETQRTKALLVRCG